ncbi:MAG: hypothetical protein KAJ10_09950, partial [Thermodesulfovibrionia bacterium]|nr:hypothetical protein [Thermodesulfovibrionia bacterium]
MTGKSDISGTDQSCEIVPEKIDIDTFTMVIFGATGDLSRRKLLPTLYHLCEDQNLPDEFAITGFASRKLSDEEFRRFVRKALEEFSEDTFKEDCWENFSKHLYYVSGNFDNADSYKKLSGRLEEIAMPAKKGTREIIYYMAVPPVALPSIFENLSLCKLC